jgi:hypothetical protein
MSGSSRTLGSGSVLVMLLAGCVTTSGQSPTEIKEELQSTFLYQSAAAFRSDDARDPFNVDARIAEPNKRLIREEFDRIVGVLQREIERQRAPLSQVFPAMRDRPRAAKVLMSDRGLEAPFINASNEIFIDIRVARLMYRDAVLASMKSTRVGIDTVMASERSAQCAPSQPDAILLECFLALKTRVDRLKNQSSMGMGFSMMRSLLSDNNKFDFDNEPWFVAADLKMSSVDLQTRYQGVLLFVVAHEIAHVMLGHVDPANRALWATPQARKQAELDADAFAVTLLSLATVPGMFFGHLDNLAVGFESFFSATYGNARWQEGGGDSHPSRDLRLQRVRSLHEHLRNTQHEQFWTQLERAMTAERANASPR